MRSSKYPRNDRYDYSCIDLRILKRKYGSRQPWPRVLFQGLKKVYERCRRSNPALSSASLQNHLADRFIWAAGLIVFVIAVLK